MKNKSGKNKLCPYKKLCRDECYGENPCSFAKAFDGLQRKISRLEKENEELRKEKAYYKARSEK